MSVRSVSADELRAAGVILPEDDIARFTRPGSRFTYTRLAEDVLFTLFNFFRVQRIPSHHCNENHYEVLRADFYIARQPRLDQLIYRGLWYSIFSKNDAALLIKNDITRLYCYVSHHIHAFRCNFIEVHGKCSATVLFHISFAFMVELTLYLMMKGKLRSITKKMPRMWYQFFSNDLMLAFSKEGGLCRMVRKTKSMKFMDLFAFDFIRAHCYPYTGEPVYEKLLSEMEEKGIENRYVQKVRKQIDSMKRLEKLNFPLVHFCLDDPFDAYIKELEAKERAEKEAAEKAKREAAEQAKRDAEELKKKQAEEVEQKAAAAREAARRARVRRYRRRMLAAQPPPPPRRRCALL